MLRQLRSEKTMKTILWSILAVVIPSFVVFYGWQSSAGGRGGYVSGPAATVKYGYFNKKDIGQEEMHSAKKLLQSKLQAYAQADNIKLDSSVLDRVVETSGIVHEAVNLEFLEKFARDYGIIISDAEVSKFLQTIPVAQRPMFMEYLKQQNMTIDEYGRGRQRDMLLNRVRQILAAATRVTYHEAWLDYAKTNEKLIADYVRFNVMEYANKVKVDENDLKSYYEKNLEKFHVPDQVQYGYILVSKEDLRSSVTVSRDEITSQYNQHKEEYRLPPSVRARQILLERPMVQDSSTTAVEEATSKTMAQARSIYDQIVKGGDFAKLADQYSQEKNFPPREDESTTASDANTTAGGNLGYLLETTAKNYYGDDWTTVVFNMQPGSVSQPFETRSGIHIVKLEAKKEGVIQPLAKVERDIKNKLTMEKVDPLFQKIGDELRADAPKYTTLEALAKATSTTVRQTPKVERSVKFIPGIGRLGEFEESVNDLQKGGISGVLADETRLLVMELKEEFPAHDPPLSEVKNKVSDAYKRFRGAELAKTDAEQLRKKSPDLKALQTTAKDMGLTVTHSTPFKASEVVMTLGGIPDFEKLVRQTKVGGIYVSPTGPEDQPTGYVLWHLAEKITPSNTEFQKALPKLMQEIAERKSQVLVEEYLRDQWKEYQGKIKINPAFQ